MLALHEMLLDEPTLDEWTWNQFLDMALSSQVHHELRPDPETLFFVERSSKWIMLCKIWPIGLVWLNQVRSGKVRLGKAILTSLSKKMGRKLEGETSSQSLFVSTLATGL
jgi:hypothetical protein